MCIIAYYRQSALPDTWLPASPNPTKITWWDDRYFQGTHRRAVPALSAIDGLPVADLSPGSPEGRLGSQSSTTMHEHAAARWLLREHKSKNSLKLTILNQHMGWCLASSAYANPYWHGCGVMLALATLVMLMLMEIVGGMQWWRRRSGIQWWRRRSTWQLQNKHESHFHKKTQTKDIKRKLLGCCWHSIHLLIVSKVMNYSWYMEDFLICGIKNIWQCFTGFFYMYTNADSEYYFTDIVKLSLHPFFLVLNIAVCWVCGEDHGDWPLQQNMCQKAAT
jgi:hypothetical protein